MKIHQDKNPNNTVESQKQELKRTRSRPSMSVPYQKLKTTEIPGYYTHWMNDYPGRIATAQQCGWEFVKPEEANIIGDSPGVAPGESGNTDLGNKISIYVGRTDWGTPLRAFLMKLKLEYWYEDQEARNQVSEAFNEQIRSNSVPDNAEPGTQFARHSITRNKQLF